MKFSIIVPVYNDPHISACIQSLLRLDYPREDFEIIIVDNNSDVGTRESIQSFPVHYAYEKQTGSYLARNCGARIAQGDILVFTDSDCVVDKNWLRVIAKSIQFGTVDAVMGYAKGNNTNKIARYEQTMYEANIATFTQTTHLQRIDTRNFAVTKTAFKAIGGFTDALQYGGDMEFGARLAANHYTVVFDNTMVVTHTNPTKLPRLLKKRIRQNFGNMKIIELHNSEFVKTYFAHLLRYDNTVANKLLWWFLQIWILSMFPSSGIICILLPGKLGYWYFKLNNVIAMRFGQLNYVLGYSI